MPYMRRRRSAPARRFARKRNGYKRRRTGRFASRSGGQRRYGTMISRNPITSDNFSVKLKYSEIRNVVGGTGTTATYVFRGNGIRDPNFTGTGGSVTGSAQWYNFYSNCFVIGSKCNIKVINGATQMAQVCLYPNRNSTSVNTGSGDLREIPYGRTKSTGIYSASAQNMPVHLSNYFTTAKIHGVSKSEIKDNYNYANEIAADPINQWFWILDLVWASSVTTSYVFDVDITYYCIFKRRVNVVV